MNSHLEVTDHSLVVFIDETGEESLRDPNFPLFGLAGCAMRADVYFTSVASAWRDLKARHFGGPDVALHASTVDLSNTRGIESLGHFFRTQIFSRLGAVVTHLTSLENIDPFETAAISLLQRLREAARWWSDIDSIALICEQSDRGDELIKKHLSGWTYWRELGGQRTTIPVTRNLMPKLANEPGIQVADFVAQTLGASTRSRLAGKLQVRADFAAVFADVDRRMVSTIEINAANKH